MNQEEKELRVISGEERVKKLLIRKEKAEHQKLSLLGVSGAEELNRTIQVKGKTGVEQVEGGVCSGRHRSYITSGSNLDRLAKKRHAYASMPVEQKAQMLSKRRELYRQRKLSLSAMSGAASQMRETKVAEETDSVKSAGAKDCGKNCAAMSNNDTQKRRKVDKFISTEHGMSCESKQVLGVRQSKRASTKRQAQNLEVNRRDYSYAVEHECSSEIGQSIRISKKYKPSDSEKHNDTSNPCANCDKKNVITGGVIKRVLPFAAEMSNDQVKRRGIRRNVVIAHMTEQMYIDNKKVQEAGLMKRKLKDLTSIFTIYEEGSTSRVIPFKFCNACSSQLHCSFLDSTADVQMTSAEMLSTSQQNILCMEREVEQNEDACRTVCALAAVQTECILQKRQRKKASRTAGKKCSKGTDLLQYIQSQADTLPIEPNCPYCGARKFYSEYSSFCCSNGEVILQENNYPEIFVELFLGNSEEAITFRRFVRTYNNSFAFTSLGVRYDKSLATKAKGAYIFKVQGQLYHYINHLVPEEGKPSFLQLYFYDTDHEVQNRMATSEKFCEIIILKLMKGLEANPYASFFRRLKDIKDLPSYDIFLKTNPSNDQRVFNKPSVSQIAAMWIDGGGNTQQLERHIRVYSEGGSSYRINYYYGCYDPLQYPLLYPYGETGWHEGIQRSHMNFQNRMNETEMSKQAQLNANTAQTAEHLLNIEEQNLKCKSQRRQTVSMREYYAYKFQMRSTSNSLLLHAGRLLQQYTVDMYVKLESQRLDFIRNKQLEFRREHLQGIVDSVVRGENSGLNVGQRVLLPASFIGGPRDMKRRYVDAMTLVERFGKPDIFLTMTCNPAWPEIKDNMLPTDEVENRPDLVARVFHAKLQKLKEELFKKSIFGEVAAYTYVIEFQKRGLPHAHFLLIMKPSSKLYSSEAFDKIVSAELPNKEEFPHLHQMVVKHMMHGPCGHLKPDNICMKADGTCRSRYPKQWQRESTHSQNGYPMYRRRNDGQQVKVRGKMLDNRWVVPYNPYLLAKFDCHINVEICSTLEAVKYVYKYIYKGHDRISFQVNSDDLNCSIDEIKNFQSARWVSPPEAMWRIFAFPLSEMKPSVIHLQLHLENFQNISFKAANNLKAVLSNPFCKKTMLTEFFSINRYESDVRRLSLTYKQFPEQFVWIEREKRWKYRKQRDVVGRIVLANPAEGERYFLRLLLLNVRAPTSFDDLKTVNGQHVDTFQEAAILRGLFYSNDCQEQCLEEAALFHMPYALHRLFATILSYIPPENPRRLWHRFKESMSEDFRRLNVYSNEDIEKHVLCHLDIILQSMGKDINSFCLVPHVLKFNDNDVDTRDVCSERNVVIPPEDIAAIEKLNIDQANAFRLIIEKVYSGEGAIFFIDGPGGTGKTFLYRALLADIRSKGHIALATATSGVAASILPGGRTAHSRFKIPINIHEQQICNLSKQSSISKLIQEAKLIIWDEAPMVDKAAVEAVDLLLKDLMNVSTHFGNKVIVCGGDFRQVLPVVPKGTREDSVAASLISSHLWPSFQRIQLTINMRAREDPSSVQYLLNIGNGVGFSEDTGDVKIPESMLLKFTYEQESLHMLIDAVYPSFEHFFQSSIGFRTNRAILTTKNDYVDDVNRLLIEKFPGTSKDYISQDKPLDDHAAATFEDLLYSLKPNGFPPHVLTLKPSCPAILLRNIDPPEGLSNGTRLICRTLRDHVIDAVIAAGENAGKQVFIHRITFKVSSSSICPIGFQRHQFPLRLCFAMTINKAQGQTLDFLGIYLKEPVFSHGQLYVALSRAKSSKFVKILIRPPLLHSKTTDYTKNIVYHDVLSLAASSFTLHA